MDSAAINPRGNNRGVFGSFIAEIIEGVTSTKYSNTVPILSRALLGADHFESFAVHIDDLDGVIWFEMPAQLCDVDIH